jgi:hypothetical protein
MPVDVDAEDIREVARGLFQEMRTIIRRLRATKTNVESDRYDDVLAIPRDNVAKQGVLANATALGRNAAIVRQLNDNRGSTYTVADIAALFAAYDNLANTIETNANRFTPTINSATKRIEFVTPLNTPVKNALVSRINDVLATAG